MTIHRTTPRLAPAALLWLCVSMAFASGEMRLEMTLRADGDRRGFTFEARLDRQEAEDFRRDRQQTIQRYVQLAQQAYAEKKGYHPSIYGADYWKILRVVDWDWKVEDVASGRTESSGSKGGKRMEMP